MSAFFLDNYKNKTRERSERDERSESQKKLFLHPKTREECETKAKGKILRCEAERKKRGVLSVERKKIDERREAKNFGFKNKKFKKEDTHFSLQWSVVVVACAYFMRGKYTLNTNTNCSTTRAFSEREREKSA